MESTDVQRVWQEFCESKTDPFDENNIYQLMGRKYPELDEKDIYSLIEAVTKAVLSEIRTSATANRDDLYSAVAAGVMTCIEVGMYLQRCIDERT